MIETLTPPHAPAAFHPVVDRTVPGGSGRTTPGFSPATGRRTKYLPLASQLVSEMA